MNLLEYFENAKGMGVLGTADSAGGVNLAIYGRPHVKDDENIAFIMADRLSHENTKANPHAVYLFVERGDGYKGVRLYLTRTGEETDPQKIEEVRRPGRKGIEYGGAKKFLVHFKVGKIRPLTGD